jgi:starch phosphorylase
MQSRGDLAAGSEYMASSVLTEQTSSEVSADTLGLLYQRHLADDHVVRPRLATPRQKFEALARAVRDLIAQRWLGTIEQYDRENPKRVYYLSMEYLIGRSLWNNVVNLGAEEAVHELAGREQFDIVRLADEEPDAGLGNGGLGRLAACYIDSMATLGIPAVGYGLRYDYGIFRQQIAGGYQDESPDHWLLHPDPWEVSRAEEQVEVKLNSSLRLNWATHEHVPDQTMTLLGVPYDRPVVGYGGRTINTLRLWRASTPEYFDLQEFDTGDFVGAMLNRVVAGSVTRVLYPDDETSRGRMLRFVQEYFLVACSLADILGRFRRDNRDWHALPHKVAVQLNDTHPSLAVAELMRVLLDDGGLDWDDAWDVTRRTLAFTNHTLLAEALEKWAVSLFEQLLPRHLEIIYEINRRLLDDVRQRYPGDVERVRRISLVTQEPQKRIRMAHLAVVGSHSTNGVARLHSQLLRSTVLADLAEMYPGRFNNKTNGVTPRRWLLMANPGLAELIDSAVGDGWITDLRRLRDLLPLADDAEFRAAVRRVKHEAKTRFADWLRDQFDHQVDPATMFDCQVKRIHEYKRQLLNLLQVIVQYHRLRDDPQRDFPPRTVFFAGKAAPAYRLAKLIIKLINNVAAAIDADPATRGRLKVLFLPDYGVTLAEHLIPAADLSEQISTAGYEASGTSNMKFMMNGALTIGTHDGATIEMAEQAGRENFFLFGLTADQVEQTRPWYDPHWHYEHCPETRRALDAIAGDHFSRDEPGIFAPICEALLGKGDRYLHLADLDAYVQAQQEVGDLYHQPDQWFRKVILNIGASGKFSSDRAIVEYAREIWGVEPALPGT